MKSLLFFGLVILIVPSAFTLQRRAPVLDLQSTDYYRGTVKTTDTVASISPEIRVLDDTGPICSYEISPLTASIEKPNESNHTLTRRSIDQASKKIDEDESSSELDDSEEDDFDNVDQQKSTTNKPKEDSTIPFRIEVTDKSMGKALIRLKDHFMLACKDAEYAFKITPKRCGQARKSGDSAIVKITVIQSNDHDPVFDRLHYDIMVEEGKTYDAIAQVKATDTDCGLFGKICGFELMNERSGKFEITENGIVKIVKPLNHTETSKHTFTVVAEDCGKRRSQPANFEVVVREVCKVGLHTDDDRVSYGVIDGVKPVLPTVDARLCSMDCQKTQEVIGKVTLAKMTTSETGCDRERYDAKLLQATCGADALTVDLLPDPTNVHAIIKEENVSAPALDKNVADHDFFSSADVYAFDGEKNAVIVPPETTSPHIPDTFTLSFWMKHDRPKVGPKMHEGKLHKIKENILCSSDDHRLNRHHFAVYIRNCKLELLIRREIPNKKGESEFQPAEWRWRIAEVCDNHWHHYSFNMKFPQLDLYVDGKPVAQTEDNLEILDDWPMHVVNGIKTKLVVGACWHGGASRMTQFFNGYLSEMTYLAGKVERPTVLPCTLQCKEQLDFNNLKRLKIGEEAVFNADMSELTLKATNISDYLDLLRKVAYANHKSNPTPGERTITISTSFTCVGKKTQKMELPNKVIHVDVKRAADPIVTIDGTSTVNYSQTDLEQGVVLLPKAKIFWQGTSFGDANLDYCKIRTKPALNREHEYFSSPAALINGLNMIFEHSNDGLLVKGSEKSTAYEALLQQIHYFNSRPSEYEQRQFIVQCSSMAERVKSNEFMVTMKIQAPLIRELKPSADNQSETGDSQEKMRPPTMMKTTPSFDSSTIRTKQHDHVANIISDPASTTSRLVDTSQKENDNGNDQSATTSMFEQRKSIPLLLLHEEAPNRHHHLTLDKLAADAPRPSLGGPLPLLHQADIGEGFGNGAVAGSGSAVAIVIVVCVGFLLLLIVVGIIKIRSTHRRMIARQHRRLHRGDNGEAGVAGDLAWDDAGMNITVNPLEVLTEKTESREAHEDDYSECSSEEDDDGSYREDEECSDDEEDEQVLPHVSSVANGRNASTDSAGGASTSGGLEWDDTTLTHSTSNPRTQTYRV